MIMAGDYHDIHRLDTQAQNSKWLILTALLLGYSCMYNLLKYISYMNLLFDLLQVWYSGHKDKQCSVQTYGSVLFAI